VDFAVDFGMHDIACSGNLILIKLLCTDMDLQLMHFAISLFFK